MLILITFESIRMSRNKNVSALHYYFVLVLLGLCAYKFQAIGIPIRFRQVKCMIVYSVGQSETVKITAKFPEIPDRVHDEYYQININNTETYEVVSQRSLPGVYKRQLQLKSNIIYQVCFTVRSGRDFGRVLVQYTAQNLFNLDHAQIKVPQRLIKQGDFKGAYLDTQRLFQVTQKFTAMQVQRKLMQQKTFIQNNQLSQQLIQISIIQMGIIILAGLYQFYAVRKYLVSKQYI